MSDFTAKMHQIQFRLGLCPRSRWWSYSAPTRLPIAGGMGLAAPPNNHTPAPGPYRALIFGPSGLDTLPPPGHNDFPGVLE